MVTTHTQVTQPWDGGTKSFQREMRVQPGRGPTCRLRRNPVWATCAVVVKSVTPKCQNQITAPLCR